MKRIGVIADSHSHAADGADLPDAVLKAFEGVDLIVHCGDAGAWGGLDRLATVAPVIGVLGGHNGQGEDPRITGTKRVVDLDGVRTGVVFDPVREGLFTQTHPSMKPASSDLRTALSGFFGGPVDLVLHGGTHVPRVSAVAGVLFVNPGSATIPLDRPKGAPLGAVALVDCDAGVATARIVELWR